MKTGRKLLGLATAVAITASCDTVPPELFLPEQKISPEIEIQSDDTHKKIFKISTPVSTI